MEYYEPTCLFRQNAIRQVTSKKSSLTLCHNNETSFTPFTQVKNTSSWLLKNNFAQDTSVMNKACSLSEVEMQSNYWKMPDAEMNLTALALNDTGVDTPLVAISSGNLKHNLYIHELDTIDKYLTHHTTISLPNIHGLAWVPNTNSRFLISGNNKGYAHLVSIPRPLHYAEEETENESAEIIKRFNHRKHLKSVHKESMMSSHSSTCISELGFLSSGELVTSYDDTLFIWNMNDVESAMRPRPESISVVSGLRSFDTPMENNHTLALCGTFGVSLFDTRSKNHSVPKSLLSKLSPQYGATNKVKWHPKDSHILASSHADGVVRLWDIRKNETFSEMTGHSGKTITSMAWNGNELFTGASDGKIVHWDLFSDLDSGIELSGHGDRIAKCSLKEGIDSVSFDPSSNSVIERVGERQCGTALPASNHKIVGLCAVKGSGNTNSCSVLSIDGGAFLGLHSKIFSPVNSTDENPLQKTFYTNDELALLTQEALRETPLASTDNSTRPLSIIKKTSPSQSPQIIRIDSLESVDINEVTEPTTNIRTKDASSDDVLTPSDSVSLFGAERPEPTKHDYYNNWDHSSEMISLSSVDSSSEDASSICSSAMSATASASSFSTTVTLVGLPEHEMPKDSSFQQLDMELERICNSFPSHF